MLKKSVNVGHLDRPWGAQKCARVKRRMGPFWDMNNVFFLQCKKLAYFANFEPFFPCNSILLIFWIEWMFPKGSQILVHDFRHQNFGIWTFLGWVIALFMKKTRYFAPLQSNLVILPIFFTQVKSSQEETVTKEVVGKHSTHNLNCWRASAWFSQNSGVTLNIVKPVCGKWNLGPDQLTIEIINF